MLFSDCVSRDRSVSELFIAQNSFVASTAKQVRDRLTQAVLPISSAMMTIKDADIDDVLDDEQVKSIIASMGVGVSLGEDTRYGKTFSLENLRYDKVIIVTEATTEGRYIHDQVVTYLYRFSHPLIAAGNLYIVPPDNWRGMNENEFESKVMSPSTRRIVPVEPGTNLFETLRLLSESTQ